MSHPVKTDPTVVPLELLGTSPAAERLRALTLEATGGDDYVLVSAESGLSAEAIAREIHDGRCGPEAPFVVYDGASAAAPGIERDLFGRAAGRRPGHLEPLAEASTIARAAGGTLFLANIGDLPFPAQARLTQVLRDGEVEIGSPPAAVRLDVRVVAGTALDLQGEVREGRFRRDLYQRFTLRLEVPPLRRRPGDIPALIRQLAADACRASGVPPLRFADETLTLLSALPWRRNLVELKEVVDGLVRAGRGGSVGLEDVLTRIRLERAPAARLPAGSLRAARLGFERDYVAAVLQQHEWRMGDAARTLGIQRTNLYRKVRQLGIPRARMR